MDRTPTGGGEDVDATDDRDGPLPGTVAGVWLAPEGSAPMEAVESAEAVPGGLRGDRYFRGTGYYSGFDECQVTFIEAEAIQTIRDEHGIDLGDGRHRRNVVVRGVDLESLLDHRFRIGETVFEGTRPRPPCAHVEQVAGEEGVASALRGHGGICAEVVESGLVRVGEEVEDMGPVADFEGLVESIRRRAKE